MNISTLEERVDSLSSSPLTSLISSRLERVEQTIHDITPQVASSQILSRRIDSMESQLRDFKQKFSAFRGIGNKLRELESHLGSIKHSLSQYDAMSSRTSKVEGEGASLDVPMGLLERLPPPIPPTPHVSDVGGSSNHVLGELISRVSVVTAAVTALNLYINVIRISMILRCTLVQ